MGRVRWRHADSQLRAVGGRLASLPAFAPTAACAVVHKATRGRTGTVEKPQSGVSDDGGFVSSRDRELEMLVSKNKNEFTTITAALLTQRQR